MDCMTWMHSMIGLTDVVCSGAGEGMLVCASDDAHQHVSGGCSLLTVPEYGDALIRSMR